MELIGGTFTARDGGEEYGLITNGHVTHYDTSKPDIDPGILDIYGGTYHPGAYLFYPADNGDGAKLSYGDITIHNMNVVGNAQITNEKWPVFTNFTHNEIMGTDNIISNS